MPVLSMFYGIIIRMFRENKEKHHKPHFHAIYAENEIVITLDGEILEGSMPKSKLKLIDAWMELHKEELEANWKLLSENGEYYKIEPLR